MYDLGLLYNYLVLAMKTDYLVANVVMNCCILLRASAKDF